MTVRYRTRLTVLLAMICPRLRITQPGASPVRGQAKPDFNCAGNPSWVSRTHSSFPPRGISSNFRSPKNPRLRDPQLGASPVCGQAKPDLNYAGNPSWVSRTHSSFPPRGIFLQSEKSESPRLRDPQPGAFLVFPIDGGTGSGRSRRCSRPPPSYSSQMHRRASRTSSGTVSGQVSVISPSTMS